MSTFVIVLHVVTCLVLVFVVLIQSGKEGGAGFLAGGSSQTVFGSSGGANFFTKFTSAVAAIFMITSIVLTIGKSGKRSSLFEADAASGAPAATAPAQQDNTPPAPGEAKTAPQAPAQKGPAKSAPAKTR